MLVRSQVALIPKRQGFVSNALKPGGFLPHDNRETLATCGCKRKHQGRVGTAKNLSEAGLGIFTPIPTQCEQNDAAQRKESGGIRFRRAAGSSGLTLQRETRYAAGDVGTE